MRGREGGRMPHVLTAFFLKMTLVFEWIIPKETFLVPPLPCNPICSARGRSSSYRETVATGTCIYL